MDDCFVKLIPKSTIRKDLLDFCTCNNDWINPNIGTFFQKKPPQSLIFNDSFLKYVCENYVLENNFEQCVNIFMIDSWTHYMLHSDRYRSASINLLINDNTDSISYFQVSDIYNKLHVKIKELAYEQDSYYLFNSTIPHAVTNREPPRYLLSITLKYNYYKMKGLLDNQVFLNSSGATLI